MATLKSIMTTDAAAGGVFLPVDGGGGAVDFNEIWQFFPRGNAAKKSDVNLIVEDFSFAGTNEAPGDGRVINKPDGRKDRKSIILNMPSTVGVAFTQPDAKQDEFQGRGYTWKVKRLLGKDEHMQRVLCTRMERVTERGNRRFG